MDKQCVENFAVEILSLCNLPEEIKSEAREEFGRVCGKNQPRGKKMGMIALCLHNASVRKGYFFSLEKICEILSVNPKDLSNARKYFRDNDVNIENERFESVLKNVMCKINISTDRAEEISKHVMYCKAKNNIMDSFMLKTIALGILFIIEKDRKEEEFAKDMGICRNTLKLVVAELKKLNF